MTSDLLNSAQLAEYLQTSRDRAYRLMGGAIPATKVGRQWLARRADVDAYVAAGRTTAKVRTRRARGRRASP
jgi:excisionase family DNA binding protein